MTDFNDVIRRAVRDRRERVTEVTVIEDAPTKEQPLFDKRLRESVSGRQATVIEREGTAAEQRASDHMNAAIRGELPRQADEADGVASAPDFGGGNRGPASPPNPLQDGIDAMNDSIRGAIYRKRDGQYRPAVRRK